jgi:cytochrome P450
MTQTQRPSGPTRATVRDTVRVLAGVLGPVLARGVIVRRPKVVGLAQRLDLDRRAVRTVQRLDRRYGPGPVLLAVPGRRQALVLSPAQVRRVLDETPEPFSSATMEKRASLAHFQPEGVLISTGEERAARRRLNEEVLDSESPLHRLAERFVVVAREEAAPLGRTLTTGDELSWDAFIDGWFQMVRRVVLGDGARDDEGLTDDLAELRSDANWAFARPRRHERRERFLRRLGEHLARAEPGSLAAVMAASDESTDPISAPVQQVPQWLFAFDPAGMAAFRALALLATHPAQAEAARAEVRSAAGEATPTLPFLRACILESLRLWPTTPAVLRETTTETDWDGHRLPAGTGMVIFAPYFHRDDRHLPFADRFEPGVWLGEQAEREWPLIPFSAGPGICPGRNLVLLVASTMLAALLDDRTLELVGGGSLRPDRPLPGTFSPYRLRFRAG